MPHNDVEKGTRKRFDTTAFVAILTVCFRRPVEHCSWLAQVAELVDALASGASGH